MEAHTEALFTDIGGVLLTNGWDRGARRRACQQFGLDPVQLDERHHLTFDTYEAGKITLATYLERTVFYEPRSFTPAEFREFMFAQSKLLPEMLGFVRALKTHYGLKVVAVSNEGRELTEHRVAAFGLSEVIDAFVVSSFVHVRKPDADIFRMAIDVAQVAPERAVYLEDRAMFVDVAKGLGLNAVLHRSFEETRERLAELGLRLP